jgi:hypothetical protein
MSVVCLRRRSREATLHAFASELSCQLGSEQGVNQPCVLHVGMKQMDRQLVALQFIIRHPRDELKNFSVLSQGTYHINYTEQVYKHDSILASEQ